MYPYNASSCGYSRILQLNSICANSSESPTAYTHHTDSHWLPKQLLQNTADSNFPTGEQSDIAPWTNCCGDNYVLW